MSGLVDVLDGAINRIEHGRFEADKDLREARADVAELIEVATSALYDMREVRDRCCISLEMVGLDEQIEESIGRLAVALARVGGAS